MKHQRWVSSSCGVWEGRTHHVHRAAPADWCDRCVREREWRTVEEYETREL